MRVDRGARAGLTRRVVTAVLASAALAMLLAGCSQTERVVESVGRTPLSDSPARYQYSVAWSSDEYGFGGTGKRTAPDDPWVAACFDRAVVGQSVPEDCLSREVLFAETGSLTSRPWLSFTLIVVVLAAVGLICMGFIAQVPRVAAPAPAPLAPASGAAPAPEAGRLTAVVSRADQDKAAFDAAREALSRMTEPGYGRRLFWRGTLAGFAWVIALGLTVGFVTAGEWALLACLLLVLCVIIAYLAATFLSSNLTNVTHVRALFALGVALGFILGAVAGSLILDPFIEWDGVRWFL